MLIVVNFFFNQFDEIEVPSKEMCVGAATASAARDPFPLVSIRGRNKCQDRSGIGVPAC